PAPSPQRLEATIRFYGNPIQQLLTSYLEQSIGGLVRQQNLMQAEMAKALESPMAPMAEKARQKIAEWAEGGDGTAEFGNVEQEKGPNSLGVHPPRHVAERQGRQERAPQAPPL